MHHQLSFYVLRRKTAVLLYILITLAISGIIIGIVLAQERHMKVAVADCVIATVAFGAASLLLYYKKRIQVSIDGETQTIAVEDPNLTAPMFIQPPFTISRQWMVDFQKKNIQTKRLYITIIDSLGQPILTFGGGLSALQTPPANFQFLDMGESRQLVLAALCYDTMKIVEISEMLGEIN